MLLSLVLVVDLARANPREGGSQRRQIPTELPTEKNENTQPPPSLFFSLPQLHDLLHRIHRQRLWPRLPCLLLANSRQTSASPSPLLLSLCSVQPYHFSLSSPLHIPVLYSLSGLLRVLGTPHCSFLYSSSLFLFSPRHLRSIALVARPFLASMGLLACLLRNPHRRIQTHS